MPCNDFGARCQPCLTIPFSIPSTYKPGAAHPFSYHSLHGVVLAMPSPPTACSSSQPIPTLPHATASPLRQGFPPPKLMR